MGRRGHHSALRRYEGAVWSTLPGHLLIVSSWPAGVFEFAHIVVVVIIVIAAIKLIVVVVGHQFGFDIIDHFFEIAQKAVEVFFIQKDLMALVAVAVKLFGTLRKGEIEVVPFSPAHIKKISPSFAGADFF